MPSREVIKEFLYGVKLDTSGFEEELKNAQDKIKTTIEGAANGGGTSMGVSGGKFTRNNYLERFNKGSDFNQEMLGVTQEIADNVAMIAYKLGVSDKDIETFSKGRNGDFELESEAYDSSTLPTQKSWKDKIAGIKTQLSGTIKGLASAAAMFAALYKVLEKSYESAQKAFQVMAEASNKFISTTTAFVDESTKRTMMTMGVGSKQAQAINIAAEKLGISTSDFATLTRGQREAFKQLMETYQKGIDSIDTDNLDKFNENVQRYELIRAEFDVKREVAITKLFANASGIDSLVDKFGEFLDNVIDILDSPAAQKAMDLFIGFLNGVMDFLNRLSRVGSKIASFSGTSSNTTNNTTNNVNVYNSQASSSDNYALAAEIQQVLM